MALPRPVLIALLGLALCAAAFLATRSANDTGSAVTSAPAVTPSPATKQAARANAHKAAPAPAKPAAKPTTAAKPAAPAKPVMTAAQTKKLHAIKALGRGDVVVFFFTRAGPADDTGTRQAVKTLAHQKGVTVITAGYDDLETYRPVLSGAAVSQVPAVVIVRGSRKGRLLEGFIDPGTLRQTVADARR
jgi:hypothetical protein